MQTLRNDGNRIPRCSDKTYALLLPKARILGFTIQAPCTNVKLFIDYQKDRRKLVTTERQPSSPIPPIPAVDGRTVRWALVAAGGHRWRIV
jgi:hypothetical protein